MSTCCGLAVRQVVQLSVASLQVDVDFANPHLTGDAGPQQFLTIKIQKLA